MPEIASPMPKKSPNWIKRIVAVLLPMYLATSCGLSTLWSVMDNPLMHFINQHGMIMRYKNPMDAVFSKGIAALPAYLKSKFNPGSLGNEINKEFADQKVTVDTESGQWMKKTTENGVEKLVAISDEDAIKALNKSGFMDSLLNKTATYSMANDLGQDMGALKAKVEEKKAAEEAKLNDMKNKMTETQTKIEEIDTKLKTSTDATAIEELNKQKAALIADLEKQPELVAAKEQMVKDLGRAIEMIPADAKADLMKAIKNNLKGPELAKHIKSSIVSLQSVQAIVQAGGDATISLISAQMADNPGALLNSDGTGFANADKIASSLIGELIKHPEIAIKAVGEVVGSIAINTVASVVMSTLSTFLLQAVSRHVLLTEVGVVGAPVTEVLFNAVGVAIDVAMLVKAAIDIQDAYKKAMTIAMLAQWFMTVQRYMAGDLSNPEMSTALKVFNKGTPTKSKAYQAGAPTNYDKVPDQPVEVADASLFFPSSVGDFSLFGTAYAATDPALPNSQDFLDTFYHSIDSYITKPKLKECEADQYSCAADVVNAIQNNGDFAAGVTNGVAAAGNTKASCGAPTMVATPQLTTVKSALFTAAGQANNVSPAVLAALATEENGGAIPTKTEGYDRSVCGAVGLMQITFVKMIDRSQLGVVGPPIVPNESFPDCIYQGKQVTPADWWHSKKATVFSQIAAAPDTVIAAADKAALIPIIDQIRGENNEGLEMQIADKDIFNIYSAAVGVSGLKSAYGITKSWDQTWSESEIRSIAGSYFGDPNSSYATMVWQFYQAYENAPSKGTAVAITPTQTMPLAINARATGTLFPTAYAATTNTALPSSGTICSALVSATGNSIVDTAGSLSSTGYYPASHNLATHLNPGETAKSPTKPDADLCVFLPTFSQTECITQGWCIEFAEKVLQSATGSMVAAYYAPTPTSGSFSFIPFTPGGPNLQPGDAIVWTNGAPVIDKGIYTNGAHGAIILETAQDQSGTFVIKTADGNWGDQTTQLALQVSRSSPGGNHGSGSKGNSYYLAGVWRYNGSSL